MPSLVRVSGPIHHFLQFPNETSPSYLGTAEATPNYEERPNYVAVKNSLSGTTLNFNETWDGSDMMITSTLTRYDEFVYKKLRNAPWAAQSNGLGYLGVIGTDSRISRGTLMYNRFPILIMANSFYGTPNQQVDDLPGYLFYSVKYAAGIPGQGGTNANKLGITFQAVSVFDPTAANGNAFGFACYSISDPRIQQALSLVN